jgi:hypothetical protein
VFVGDDWSVMDLIGECEFFLDSFKDLLSQAGPFEPKGIFHSEMLMLCAVVNALGAEQIIESGRARGQSTEILARFASLIGIGRFDSIEFDTLSPDCAIAEERLRPLGQRVRLHYGDAFELLPSLIYGERCVLLIDGPKGPSALKLAVIAMKNRSVNGVFIHDVHKDAANVRPLIERHFPDSIFSDEEEFVEKFSVLDEVCWKTQARSPGCEGWKPYYRGKRRMKSYSATLGFLPSISPLGKVAMDECLNEIDIEIAKSKSFGHRLVSKARNFRFGKD